MMLKPQRNLKKTTKTPADSISLLDFAVIQVLYPL